MAGIINVLKHFSLIDDAKEFVASFLNYQDTILQTSLINS